MIREPDIKNPETKQIYEIKMNNLYLGQLQLWKYQKIYKMENFIQASNSDIEELVE